MHKRTGMYPLFLTMILGCSCLWAGEKPTEVTEYCTNRECHTAYNQKKYVHKPISNGVCKFCHKVVNPKEHSFKLFRTRNELCGSCHQEQAGNISTVPSLLQLRAKAPRVGKGRYLHKPVREGKCVACHNPHSSNYKFLLSAATIGESCRGECHDINENVKSPHKPVSEGECNRCHNSHGSNYRFLLINEPRQLCFSCHEDTKAELKKYKYVHKPVADRGCEVCHTSHGSDYFRLLVRNYTPEFYAAFDILNFDLCFSCHQPDKAIVKETETFTNFRNGNMSLHYLHVNTQERGRTCRTCHATHASNEPRHLRKAVPYGSWEIPIKYEQTETGGGCSPGCHNPRSYDRVKPVIYLSDKN